MKRITSVAMALTALSGLALSGCEKKTSDDLKQKAEETNQTVESKAKEASEDLKQRAEETNQTVESKTEEAKEAADEVTEKAKEEAKEADKKFDEKAKEAADSAGANTSPQPASPTPAP